MTSSDRDNLPFIVVGGGIGGLGTALALGLKGFPVHVLEQATEFKEIGAGIQLGPNVFTPFRKLGIRDRVLEDVAIPTGLEMRDALTGELVTRMPLGDDLTRRFGDTYAVIHRADLHQIIVDACREQKSITLETNARVLDYSDEGGEVVVNMEDGRKIRGRAIIGADGMWSKTRARIVGDGKPRVSGHIAYRAVLKREDVPDDLWRPDVVLWAGPRTHLVHYPLRRGELYNLVAVFHSDHYSEGWDQAGDPALLHAHFQGQVPSVLRMLEKIETWRMWVLCDREPVKNWTQGRATLVGDSAHPMLQYLAQGACMALEDAVCLADKVEQSPNDPEKAFLAYQAARYLRTARVQLMARVYGEFYHARGPAAELRDQFLRGRTPEQSIEGIAWLYGGG
ncbi:MAG: 3-hydroxybenzoate 6-monooxygenase [Beijerinckiaceae bacterium]|nr:3-hydroxybenzoate 6-monooxygenase [Beijerinckiaceae bacterium]